jgi:hypothetical protein
MIRTGSALASGAHRLTALALVVGLLAAATSPADAVLDVSGSVVAASGPLEVRVVLRNRGDRRAGPIDVVGELSGERRQALVPGGLEPGSEGAVTLGFLQPPSQPGLHALTLLLEHPLPGTPDAAGNPPMASQRAWLLLALGARPAEAVRIEASPLRLDVRGSLAVRLASQDGAGHGVRLRALTARGLRPDQAPLDVAVPPRGEVTVRVPIVRAGAPRGSRQALLLVAETPEEPLARTAVATATVEVLPDPALLPGLRRPLLWGGLALLLLALGYEVRARRATPTSFHA